EPDGVELLGRDAGFLQHVLDGAGREARIMLLAREPLLLAGRDHDAVLEERRRRVVVEAGEAEDIVGHQNWCLTAAFGPSGLGSCGRQNVGSALIARSSGSFPRRRLARLMSPTETRYTTESSTAVHTAPMASNVFFQPR